MAARDRYTPKRQNEIKTVPFMDAEEAWFWFIQAQQARNDGARFVSGAGLYPRPCEPVDILKAVDRLYRQRRLLRDHLLVLRHYGRRQMSPDPRRIKEIKAHTLWQEAMERLGCLLERKGIIRKTEPVPNSNWHKDVFVMEGVAAE